MLLALLLSHINLSIHIQSHSFQKHLSTFMLGTKKTDKRYGPCCQEVGWHTVEISQYPMLILAMQTLDFSDFFYSKLFHLAKEASQLFLLRLPFRY